MDLAQMRMDGERAQAEMAAVRWGITPPPWKVFSLPCGTPEEPEKYGRSWSVTNDDGDPSSEYSVFEDPDETLVRWVAGLPVVVPAIAGHVLTLLVENGKLQNFKDYVHKRLDEAGVPVDPDSPHKAEGCRIGGRLDWVFAEVERLRGLLSFARWYVCPTTRQLALEFAGELDESEKEQVEATREFRTAINKTLGVE